jgi:hypothetical protein
MTYVSCGLFLRAELTRGRFRGVELTGLAVGVGAFVRISKRVNCDAVNRFSEV